MEIAANPGRSIMPEWKALERIAKAAKLCLQIADRRTDEFDELRNAIRDYEVLKYDGRSKTS